MWFKDIFSKKHKKPSKDLPHEENIQFEYTDPKDLSSDDSLVQDIPVIQIPESDKPVVLLIDDNAGIVSFLYDDFVTLDKVAVWLRGYESGGELTKSARRLEKALEPKHREFLKKFKLENYNILKVTGTMGAFSVEDALFKGLKVDFALVDIFLGGYRVVNRKNVIYDGVDLSGMILDSNPSAFVKFYTGCGVRKGSSESDKYEDLTGNSIKGLVVRKGPDIKERRLSVIRLLMRELTPEDR